jgi:hypothetical protein
MEAFPGLLFSFASKTLKTKSRATATAGFAIGSPGIWNGLSPDTATKITFPGSSPPIA